MPRLSVEFELQVPSDAKAKGAQAGSQFAQGFTQGAGNLSKAGLKQAQSFMQGLGPAARASMMSQLGMTVGPTITPPGLAPGANKFQQMLNMQPLFQQTNRLRSLILGAAVAPFSSWIGSRLLSDAAFGGKAGGGGHGLLGGGGAGGFAEFFIGIEALKKAFEYGAEKIKEVVERGFNLYVKAAQLRTNVGSLFALQEAAKQVGLSQSDIDKFLLRNQWGKARTSLQNFGVFSQLGGMTKDFQEAYKWASEIQGKWQDTSRTTYEMHVNFDRIKTDWDTMWNNSGFLKAINFVEKWLEVTMHLDAMQGLGMTSPLYKFELNSLAGLKAALGAKSGEAGGPTGPLFGLKQSLPQMGAWEKMGFVISSGKVPDKLDKTNSLLSMILSGINQMVKNAVRGADALISPYTSTSGNIINPP